MTILTTIVTSHKEYPAVRSLTYVCRAAKDGMEEETDVFALYSSSLRVAMGIKSTSGTVGQYLTYWSVHYIEIVPHLMHSAVLKMAS